MKNSLQNRRATLEINFSGVAFLRYNRCVVNVILLREKQR